MLDVGKTFPMADGASQKFSPSTPCSSTEGGRFLGRHPSCTSLRLGQGLGPWLCPLRLLFTSKKHYSWTLLLSDIRAIEEINYALNRVPVSSIDPDLLVGPSCRMEIWSEMQANARIHEKGGN
jgi:hypothetical protein